MRITKDLVEDLKIHISQQKKWLSCLVLLDLDQLDNQQWAQLKLKKYL